MADSTLANRMAAVIWRSGPALAGIWLVGDIAQSLIRWLAVIAGQQNRMLGVAVLTMAILARVVTIVAMFRLVERTTIASAAAPSTAVFRSAIDSRRGFAQDVSIVLIPFFLYYVAWGLVGDMMRSYGLLSLSLDQLGRYGPLLDVPADKVGIIWVLSAWAIRRAAKSMQKRQPGVALWPFLIVAAEAMWLFVGVYLIAVWKDEVMAFFAHLPAPSEWPGMVGAAFAQDALPRPADRPVEPPGDTLLAVAAFAVLPLVWFNLGAIIRGSDIETLTPALKRRVGTAAQRWRAVPRLIRDFVDHFIADAIRRWKAVANAAASMANLSLGLLVGVVVGYRLIDWLAAWGIWGTMQLVGPLEYEAARIAEYGLDLFWGTPRSPGNGLLPEVLKICLISAALDLVARRRPAGEASALG